MEPQAGLNREAHITAALRYSALSAAPSQAKLAHGEKVRSGL